ncbi:MAG: hypothetical protein JWP30_855, partial [Homoserinimonas sp.]|nr:hypothetical protein [Homoserinimonas sp.]
MRITDRHASLALASAVVLTLGGCLAPSPKIDSPPQPTSDPVFANDEEALAAATDAYAAY